MVSVTQEGGKKCGQRLRRFFIRLFWFCLLFWSLSYLSLSAMAQEDIVNNLTLSSQLLTTLDNQLTLLETDLNNKNQSLLNLETTNQKLNEQLTQQTLILNNLSETNKTLTAQWEQSVELLNDSQTQLTSLSEELRKVESSKTWGIVGGVISGILVGAVGTWALLTFGGK